MSQGEKVNILLFVYGTLKSGFSRNHAVREQRYLGTAKTKPEYGMYALSGYPALLNKKLAEISNVEANNSIYGEIYEINEECLENLDKIEGVDTGLFERKIIEIEQYNLFNLPLTNSCWQSIEKSQAQAYLYKRKVAGAADCGNIWTKR